MSNYKYFIFLIFLFGKICCCYAAPAIYLFLDGDRAEKYKTLLKNPQVKGAQIIYAWKLLEPQKNIYNFKPIERDLKYLNSIHKSLFIQIQDKSFTASIVNIPSYLLNKKYAGGVAAEIDNPGEGKALANGWIAKQWVPAVQQRFQKLLIKLGRKFDGHIKGINLSETSIDLSKHSPGFSNDLYFATILNNMHLLRVAFPKSEVVQYVNFFPGEWNNDHHYMSRLFAYAVKNHIGLGGPDVVPYRRGYTKNSYPFFHRYKGKLAFVTAAPDYTYINPKTGAHFTAKELYNFAKNYLGANIIFWTIQQPQFSQQVLPF